MHVCIARHNTHKHSVSKSPHKHGVTPGALCLQHFLLCGLRSLCHRAVPRNAVPSADGLSCSSVPSENNGQPLLCPFTAAAACKSILECLANWLIKYEGVQCAAVLHRACLASRFGCLILATETVKRTDNGVQQSLNLLCDIMKMGNDAIWTWVFLRTVFGLRFFNNMIRCSAVGIWTSHSELSGYRWWLMIYQDSWLMLSRGWV